MAHNTIISKSQKYKVVFEDDADDGEKAIYTTYSKSGGETQHETNAYIIVSVIRIADNHIIHQYKQHNGSEPFNGFVKIRDQEWWFGGRHYMLKLFVNCETGEVFDDPLRREESSSYESGYEFIWTGPCIVSPGGNYMMMDGCVWSFPYETKLYDISELSSGGGYKYLRTMAPYMDDGDSDSDDDSDEKKCAGIYDGDDAELSDVATDEGGRSIGLLDVTTTNGWREVELCEFIYTNRRFPS